MIAENDWGPGKDRIPGSPDRMKGKKWKRYSGLFILLKQKWFLSKTDQLRRNKI
jgi:hypothetical protein